MKLPAPIDWLLHTWVEMADAFALSVVKGLRYHGEKILEGKK